MNTTPIKSACWAVLLWGSRCFAAAILVVTLLPLIKSGSWVVRAWDFPRLQLAALCLVVVLALLACIRRYGWRPDIWGLMIALGLASARQFFQPSPATTKRPR